MVGNVTKVSINPFPKDLVLEIMNHAYSDSIVALALTSQKFYQIFKIIRPLRLSIQTDEIKEYVGEF